MYFPTRAQIEAFRKEGKIEQGEGKVCAKPHTNFGSHQVRQVLGVVKTPCMVDGPSARYTIPPGYLILSDDRIGLTDGVAAESSEYFMQV
jgi:hypothetical protein